MDGHAVGDAQFAQAQHQGQEQRLPAGVDVDELGRARGARYLIENAARQSETLASHLGSAENDASDHARRVVRHLALRTAQENETCGFTGGALFGSELTRDMEHAVGAEIVGGAHVEQQVADVQSRRLRCFVWNGVHRQFRLQHSHSM